MRLDLDESFDERVMIALAVTDVDDGGHVVHCVCQELNEFGAPDNFDVLVPGPVPELSFPAEVELVGLWVLVAPGVVRFKADAVVTPGGAS